MPRLPRPTAPLALLFLLSACEAPSPRAGSAPTEPAEAPRIEWQRSLDDALLLAATEQRPLLIAVNMDGESASDRIVHENYRDPAFVAAANKCVCVVASVFRHNPRDHDDRGQRIPCPRLGCVTCGEHMAMEPRLFEKLLADGDRVAPRHALVLPDGKKVWDLSLNFDLHDIDRALFASTKDVKERTVADPGAASWEELAARRDHAGRRELERRLSAWDRPDSVDAPGAEYEATMLLALRAISTHGDAGSLDALRLVGRAPAGRRPGFAGTLLAPLVAAARARDLAPSLAAIWRERLGATSEWFGDADAMALVAALDGAGAATRSLLLTFVAIDSFSTDAIRVLGSVLSPAQLAAVVDALSASGGPFSVACEVALASPERKTAPNGDAMPAAADLEVTLGDLEKVPAAERDAGWHARFAKASLDLARHRLVAQQKDAPLLLEDAELHWQKALDRDPQHAEWWIERARTAYFQGRFADEAAHGQRAFEVASTGHDPTAALQDPIAVEALRWAGDGHARLLGTPPSDPAVEMRAIVSGLKTLTRVATSAYGTAKDCLSLASLCSSLGLQITAKKVAPECAMRFPNDGELRQYLNTLLWTSDDVTKIADIADVIAKENAGVAEAHWHVGYAYMLAAEHWRRIELPEVAHREYGPAAEWFAKAMSVRADYADNCKFWIALSWLGRGLAHVQVGHRRPAADCLVEAVQQHADLASARDGLGYDVLDLVDKIFEWRDAGPSDVDPLQLLGRLLAAAPGTPFYGIAIADSQLREALRADGRNPQRVERDTVDAGGKRIRMLMGLATDEGDRYLRGSLAAARRVLPLLATDEDKKVLAQSDTIWAERMLERDRLDDVHVTLTEAATLLGEPAPAVDADAAALRAVAAQLRTRLGEARPRQREGR